MEKAIIWLVALVLVTAIFVPYFIKFRRSQRLAEERKKEAVALGIDKPRGQFPLIDHALCIGCGSCVDACPEGDVLGVVWGRAEVINGERCVGHGYCEKACPVSALKVGLGDVRTRPDLPILSDCNETTVPNMFIAGELSGMSLIRHAIAQGRKVTEEIAQRSIGNFSGDLLDIIIVGAGPAGLAAALTAKQHELRYVVLDQYDVGGTILHYPRRKVVMTQPVEIPLYGRLNRSEYSKEQLLEIWQQIHADEHLDIHAGKKVERISHHEVFTVECADGQTYRSLFLILAMGRRGSPRRLNVTGENLPKVMYQLIDAQSYENKHLLVVGGGDSAIEAAIGLARQPGNIVSISYRKDRFVRIRQKNQARVDKMINGGKIIPYFSSTVNRITESATVLNTADGELEIPNDYVFVQIGGIPPYEMLQAAGIEFGGETHSLAEVDSRLATAG